MNSESVFRFEHYDLNYKKHLPAHKNARILDIGCGEGILLAYLRKQGYHNMFGVDRSAERVNLAKVNVTPNVECTENLEAYLEQIEEPFDLIVMKDVIYYFPADKIVRWTSLIARALKPSGKLVVEIFNGASFSGPFTKYKDYRIQHILTEHSLSEILADAGLNSISLSAVQFPLHTFKRRIFYVFMKTFQLFLKFAYFCERGLDETNAKILSPKIIAVAVNKTTHLD